jgi:ubiquinol-cytochrome c reductase iron-sulfur subunit
MTQPRPTIPTLDKDRRTWLLASGAMGCAGAAAVAIPFVSSFTPSERAKA